MAWIKKKNKIKSPPQTLKEKYGFPLLKAVNPSNVSKIPKIISSNVMEKILHNYIFKKISVMEEFRKVSVNENYEISNYGNLRRQKATGDYFNLKGSIQKTNGYKFANITNPTTKKRQQHYIHNLVLTAFKGDRPKRTETSGKFVCDHFNRCKTDNRIGNLRWVTERENLRNTDRFHSDVAEMDPIKRRNILAKRRRDNPEGVMRRRKGQTGYIKQLEEKKYWVVCRINNKRYKKTVNGSFKDAEDYAIFMNRFYRK